MKKILLLIAMALCLSVTAQSDEGCDELFEAYSYYEDGSVKFVGTADCQDRPHGKFVEYRSDGKLLGTGEFNHGVRVGVWTTYSMYEDAACIIYFDDQGNKLRAEKVVDGLVVEERTF